MAHVFLSYLEDDKAYADQIVQHLGTAGFSVWVDSARLRKLDKDWHQAVDNAIGDSFVLVLVTTPASLQSTQLTYEWAFALGIGVEVIPVLFEDVPLPSRFSVLRKLDFCTDESRQWNDLLKLVKSIFDTYSPHRVRISQEMQTVRDVDTEREKAHIAVTLDGETTTYTLDSAISYVGRDPTNDIVLPHGEISRHHMRIVHTVDGFTIEDLGSRNGTYINDERVSGVELLYNGDAVRLGNEISARFEVIFSE